MVSADEGFFHVLKVELLAGKMLDSTSEKKVMINEAAAQLMGYQDPRDALGAIIPNFTDRDLEVIGVVKNYHQLSLRKAYEPTLYTNNAYWDKIRSWNSRYILIRLADTQAQDLPNMIARIQQTWKKTVSDDPFQYFFLDNFFEQQHHTDHVTGSLFIFFSGYSIFITCIGLFGLIAYSILRRTHEIGIRKVLGATAANVISLMSKDYLKIFVVAVLISAPIARWAVDLWLTQYTFRIDPGVSIIVLPVLLVAAIMAGTLIVKTYQAARVNPADALKGK
jgi:putative ABC transport system permease protein